MAIQERPYADLIGRMHQASRHRRLPVRAMFELTYRCNFACIHCYNSDAQKASRPSDEVTTDEARAIIDQLRAFGCFILGFTGGEVFVRPDAMTIFQHAKRQGFQVIIYTNGYYIDERLADELRALAPNKIDISLHGMSRDVFGRITRRPDARDRVYRAIELLVERGVPVGLKSNLFADNQHEMNEIRRFADSIGALHRLSTEFYARNDGSPEPYRYQLSPDTIDRALRALDPDPPPAPAAVAASPGKTAGASDTECASGGADVDRISMFTCGVGTTGLAITPFGEVKPCLEFDRPAFKIAEHTLAGCWERVVRWAEETSRIDASEWECATCDLQPYCNSCPASRYLATGSVAKCDPQARQRAEFKRQQVTSSVSVGADPPVSSEPMISVPATLSGCSVCTKGCS